MSKELCGCGSGRRFDRCHGDPANDFARVQALAEAREIPVLFPSVRLQAPEVLAYADRVAREHADAESVSDELLDQGLALLGSDDVRRPAEAWADAYPDRWASLRHTAADDVAAIQAVARGALDVAIHERQPTPPDVLAELECTAPVPSAAALALVLPPPLVWSMDEARAAAAAARGRSDDDALSATAEVAAALGRLEHETRVRSLSKRISAELPRRGYPRTSRTLAKACRLSAADLAFVRAVLAVTLHTYARQLDQDRYVSSLN